MNVIMIFLGTSSKDLTYDLGNLFLLPPLFQAQ
jgi:hypothetical protein